MGTHAWKVRSYDLRSLSSLGITATMLSFNLVRLHLGITLLVPSVSVQLQDVYLRTEHFDL